MTTGFSQVERPGAARSALIAALVATVTTGKAIHVPLGNRTLLELRQSLYNPMKRRGYRLRLREDGPAYARGWLEVPSSPRKKKGRPT